MTAIAGVVYKDKVWIGGDSAGVDSSFDLMPRADEKVFVNGPMVFGFTSSFRMGQILRYAFTPPPCHGDVDVYMAVDFIDTVRSALAEAGYATKRKGQESGGTFLVGFRGRLYMIGDDYQVGVPADKYFAVGAGQNQVLGSLYATPEMKPKPRIALALAAAEHFSAAVRGPFTILREP